ncbi:MAG TPA: YuiB family protein [Metalysinibacillus sp.]
MSISIVQLIISVVLFFVMFFGIGFLLNMLLRVTWFMALIYPIIVVFIIDDVKAVDYIFKPGMAFPALIDKLQALHAVDIAILGGGFAGAVVAGIVMKYLRKSGYQMF